MTTRSIDILPLVHQLAIEKPIDQGLLVGYDVQLDSVQANWPGEWQIISVNELEALAFTKRYDLAIIKLCTAHYDNNSATNKVSVSPESQKISASITRLRDLLARRVLVLATIEFTPLLRSLGFSQIEQITEQQIIWQFNILSYKQVPDWLNSKYWANPENWDKYRW